MILSIGLSLGCASGLALGRRFDKPKDGLKMSRGLLFPYLPHHIPAPKYLTRLSEGA